MPSRIGVRLVRALLPRGVRDEAADELSDLHAMRAARDGDEVADRWYWRHVLVFALRLHIASLLGPLRERGVRRVPRTRRELMRTMIADARYGARTLVRSPGFTAIAVLTLALGIGANTAIFSVIRTVLLRPLPFPEPNRIVTIQETRLDRGWDGTSFTYANFWDLHDMNRTFDAVGAWAWTTLNLTGFEHPERLSGARVSVGFFEALGVTPVAGRVFARGEDEPSSDTRVALLSHDLWMNRFSGEPGVVGRTITLDGESFTVIGVLPRGEPWLDDADVFVPLVRRPDADRGSFELAVVGRMKAGVTLEMAQSDVDGIARRLAELYPEPDKGMGIALTPSSEWVANDTLRRALWILMGGVGLLLLIACVNLANLLLARSTGRSRERALRAALGASRRRILGLVLTESMLVGVGGAVAGLTLAYAMVRTLRALEPGNIPRIAEVAIDGWVLAFTVAIALVTGVITGLVPALRTPYRDLVSALREGERSVMGNRRQGRLRGILVGTEVALSLVLLVGAGLLLRSFSEVLRVDRGFQTQNRMFFEVALSSAYDDGPLVTQFLTQYLSRMESVPQVTSSAAINMRPLRGVGVGMGFAAADKPAPSGDAVPWASWRLITRGYFNTIGARIVAGRDFTEQDLIANPWRVIISKEIADRLWPAESAVGRTLILWKGQDESQAEVIGVVSSMLDWGLERGPTLAVYIPYYGAGWSSVQFVLNTTSSPTALVPRLRSMLAEMDPSLPLSNPQLMDDMVGDNVASRRFLMLLLVSFAGLALLLALAGVYGVLAYSVARRRSEIGTRIALGASRASVLRLIMSQGMRPVLIGLVLGLVGARALSRLMSSLLFEVTPADTTTYVGVAAVLAFAAAVSCYVPARAALKLNIVSALREE
jgi:predicted permease